MEPMKNFGKSEEIIELERRIEKLEAKFNFSNEYKNIEIVEEKYIDFIIQFFNIISYEGYVFLTFRKEPINKAHFFFEKKRVKESFDLRQIIESYENMMNFFKN